MPDIFLGERPYIKNQVRVASDEFGESFGIGRPSSGVPTARKSRGRAISPGVRRRLPRRTEGGLDQLPASRPFIHNFDLLCRAVGR